MKICIIFGHPDNKHSFNAHVKQTFIDEAEQCGHDIDLIELFHEPEQLPFYRSSINPPPQAVLDYRKRLEAADVMFLISPCHNLRLNAITENWIDWVLHPTWFFTYQSMFPQSKYFKNYGYPIPGAMKGKLGIVSITYGGPMIAYFSFSIFDNIPYRRLKKSVFSLGGMRTKYLRFYEVLPHMSQKTFDRHMVKVRQLARSLPR